MHIRKDDQVIVISGNDRGKTGKVLKVFPGKSRLIVEGINFRKRATRPTQNNPQGGLVKREMPIHASNVMVICPKCGEGVRTGHKEVSTGEGRTRQMRVCRRCGEMVGGEA